MNNHQKYPCKCGAPPATCSAQEDGYHYPIPPKGPTCATCGRTGNPLVEHWINGIEGQRCPECNTEMNRINNTQEMNVVLRQGVIDRYLEPDSPIGVELRRALESATPVVHPPSCDKCKKPLGPKYYQDVPVTVKSGVLLDQQINIDLCMDCHKEWLEKRGTR